MRPETQSATTTPAAATSGTLEALRLELKQRDATIAQLQDEHARLRRSYEILKEELALVRPRLFIATAERVDTTQLQLESGHRLSSGSLRRVCSGASMTSMRRNDAIYGLSALGASATHRWLLAATTMRKPLDTSCPSSPRQGFASSSPRPTCATSSACRLPFWPRKRFLELAPKHRAATRYSATHRAQRARRGGRIHRRAATRCGRAAVHAPAVTSRLRSRQ